MGGYNSGRYRINPFLEQLLRLDVGRLPRAEGYWRFEWSNGSSIGVRSEPWGVVLDFTTDGRQVVQEIRIAKLGCHFGGFRRLLCCPVCSRHCRSLYLRRGRFVCRTCTAVAYLSQTVTPDQRMARSIRKLQKKLAPDEDVDDYVIDWIPDRPKGMRQQTYHRLVDRAERLIDARDAYLEPGILRALARLMIEPETEAG